MRPDLKKLIVERERRGGIRNSRKLGMRVRNYDPDSEFESPKRISSSPLHQAPHWNQKETTDVLNPLRGLLRKHVGRPWDKVYSELSQICDKRSVLGMHVFQHLRWEVATDTYLDGKRVMARNRWTVSEVRGFYVHPKTGLLLHPAMPVWRKRRAG
jgi:hypothetical protein